MDIKETIKRIDEYCMVLDNINIEIAKIKKKKLEKNKNTKGMYKNKNDVKI